MTFAQRLITASQRQEVVSLEKCRDGVSRRRQNGVNHIMTDRAGTVEYLLYADHVNAGTASLTIVGLTNYTGSLTKNFTIKTKNLNDSSITASPTVLTNVVYTGKPVTPVVTLKDKSTVLYSDVDYTITFDKDAAQRVEAGVSARMTLTGKNNYFLFSLRRGLSVEN